LVAGALLWAWSDEQTLVERFRTVRKIAMCLASEQHQLAKTYQAFTKMLRRWTDELVLRLQAALRQRMQQALPQHWQVAGFLLFGVDGSRVDCRARAPMNKPIPRFAKNAVGRIGVASGSPREMPRRRTRLRCG
jgi:hypothetical protein